MNIQQFNEQRLIYKREYQLMSDEDRRILKNELYYSNDQMDEIEKDTVWKYLNNDILERQVSIIAATGANRKKGKDNEL